ncbi:MAG: ATP-binding protein [Jatrophihabitantaceae bacterium]
MAGPDPTRVVSLSDLVRELNLLRSRAARESRSARVSLEELASRVGEPKSTIHAYLTGKRLAPAQMLDRMVIALGTTPTEQREWAEAWYRVCADREAVHRMLAPSAASRPTPRQLPPTVDCFIGRQDALAELDRLLGAEGGLVTLVGPPGVGTTALAVHWAQARGKRYPDGQLYVDLGGFDPDPPVQPGQALARFLRALGVPATEIPRERGERAAQFRSLVAGRRMLVLLDNARDSEQVRELLPGTPSCAVLVTSRQRLTGLVARHGARQIELPALPPADAVRLLQALAGEPVLGPEAAGELAEQCDRLPLALRLAAEQRRNHPMPTQLAAEFAHHASRLDLLTAGDEPRSSIRAIYGWSYQHLAAPAARAFRLIGHYPGSDLTPQVVAALLGSSLPEAQRQLNALGDAHLVQLDRPGHYRMPRLLRLCAGELALDAEPDQAAVARAVEHYLHTAALAIDLLAGRRQLRRADPAPGWPSAPIADAETARAWLDAERGDLLAVVDQVCQGGWPWQTVRQARTVARYLAPGGISPETLVLATGVLATGPAEDRPPAELGVNF